MKGKEMYDCYLYIYLLGVDNSPTYDYETGRVCENVMDSYKYSMEKYKGTDFDSTMQEYINMLEQSGYVVTICMLIKHKNGK